MTANPANTRIRGLEERPTIQEEDPSVTWSRRTGQLVVEVTPCAGGQVGLRFATCPECESAVAGPDGLCNVCAALRRYDPAIVQDDPQYRLDFLGAEDWYTLADAEQDRELLRQSAREHARRDRDARTPANGCRQCGVLANRHRPASLWGHGYELPPDAQRLARMKARRAAKHGGQR